MKFTNALAVAATVAAASAAGIFAAPIAVGDDLTTTTFGNEAKLVDANGAVVQSWTITNLKTSTDVIPHAVQGTLWEATATDQAMQGGVTPIVSNLNARAADGKTYRVLFGVATPQGVNPSTLTQGEKTTGKVYFDVTGEAPDSVVYNAGGEDLLVWIQAPASTGTGTGTTPRTPSTGGSTASGTAAAESALDDVADEKTADPTSATGTQPAPGTLAPTGSQGTPLPAGSAGTPVPAGSQGTPLPASADAPASAGTAVPAEAAPAVAPAAVGSQGTPVTPASPVIVVPPAG